MSTSPGSILSAMALASLGPDEFDDPELPLPELPEVPELPEPPKEPLPKEPLPKGLREEPDPLEPFPDEPEPEGTRPVPEEGAKAWVLPGLLLVVACPMPIPAPRAASAAAPARRPLRTRWWVCREVAPGAGGVGHTGAPGSVGGGPP